MEIDNLKYEELQEYILSGKSGKMSEELVSYLGLLEVVRSMYSKYQSKAAIIKTLTSKVYGLSEYNANRCFTQSINFFHSNNDIKKDAWRNILADMLMNGAYLAWEQNDVEAYRRSLVSVAEMRQLNMPDAVQLPQSVYDKRPNIYITDPSFFGLTDDTRELAAYIDALDVPEKTKLLAKRDARIAESAEFKIFDDEDEEHPEN